MNCEQAEHGRDHRNDAAQIVEMQPEPADKSRHRPGEHDQPEGLNHDGGRDQGRSKEKIVDHEGSGRKRLRADRAHCPVAAGL